MEKKLSRHMFIILSEYLASIHNNCIKRVLRQNDYEVIVEVDLNEAVFDTLLQEAKTKYLTYLENLRL